MKERRTQLRVKTDAKVVVVGAGPQYMGTLRDLCRGGARVEIPGLTAPGTTVTVIVQQSSNVFLRLAGRVASCCGDGISLIFETEIDPKLFESLTAPSPPLAA